MAEVLVLSAVSLALFLASIALSYGLAWAIERSRRHPVPEPGATLRIRSGSKLHRSKFLGLTPDGWAFHPPLERGVPVPLRVGEELFVEAPCTGGALRFRSHLVWRSSDPLMMVMSAPSDARLAERRQSPRIAPGTEAPVLLDGAKAQLIDLGERGARVWTALAVKRGERVHLRAAWSHASIGAHVIDVGPANHAELEREVRLIFEESLRLEALQKQFAPAG